MTTTLIAGALLAGLALGQVGTVAAQERAPTVEVKGLRDASKWFRVESQHFIVCSDSNSDEVVELLNNLERLDYLLRLYTKPFLVGQVSTPKLSLYFHDRTGWLAELGGARPADAIGLYNSCVSGVQAFAFNVEPLKTYKGDELAKGRLNESLSYILEAYARHFLYRHTDIRSPASFIDGFAQYFSSVRFSDNQMAVGRVPLGIGSYLHMIDDGNVYQLTFEDVLDNKKARVPDDPAALLEFQARSWNLMHFMMGSQDNRAKLARYLDMVNEGAQSSAAFAKTFELSGAALGTAMWRYRTGGVKVVQVDIPELPQASMQFSQLTQATGDFVLHDAALKACPARPNGEALLHQVAADAAQVPNNDFAQLTLCRAQIDWGNPADALAWLDAFTRRDSKHAEAFYLLGLANLKLAERAQGAQRQTYLAAAQRSLKQAVALKPGSPESSFALYKTEINGRDDPARTDVARAILAWRHGHEVSTFARSAALAYAWMGDPNGSYRAFNMLANNGRDPETADWANTWLVKLKGGVARGDLLTAMRGEAEMQPAFREWTVAHADVMADVKRNVGMEKAQGYLHNLYQGNPLAPDRPINRPSAMAK